MLLVAFMLVSVSQPVYSQVKGKWKFPVNLVVNPDFKTEARVMELRFGTDSIYYSLESQTLRNDDLLGTVGFVGYPDDANFNFFNYYDSLYRNPFDLREDSVFVNGQRVTWWGRDAGVLYFHNFRNGKILDLNGAGDFCVLHSRTTLLNEQHNFGYNKIHQSANGFVSSKYRYVFQQGTRELFHMENFDIIRKPDGSRSLVTIADEPQYYITPQTDLTGIVSLTISDTGINTNAYQFIDSVGNFFEKADFSTWQFEGKYLNGASSPTFIWCSTSVPYPQLPTNPNCRGNFYVKGPGYKYKHVLNLGNIAGVAFSELNSGYAYVSVGGKSSPYVASGIYKVNIQTGAYTSITTGNYGHSWLKKAPDGHIYAVSDNGETLGRVNQKSGLFEVAFHFPTVDVQGETHQIRYGTYQLMDDNKRCFTLPDDDQVANCVEVIGVDYEIIDCRYLRASLEIRGGVPPYQIIWQRWENSSWVTLPYTTASAENLLGGHYRVLVTDAYQSCGWFTYEFDLPVPQGINILVAPGENRVITQQDLYINDSIRVKPTGKLTLTGCNIQFKKNARLIIEDGGTVTLNNTVLTSCDSMWRGVEVWGNRTFSQEYDRNIQGWHQGRLIMSGSTIENSRNGVDLWRPNAMGNTGGIISASNSVFRNNGKAIHICYYVANANMLPKTSNFNNKCSFTNCTFEVNSDYKGEVKFYKHVDLAGVKGVKFTGCDFSVIRSSKTDTYCSGIAMYDAGATIEARGLVNNLGTPVSFDNSTFTGFYNAVYGNRIALDAVDYPVVLDRANFSDNATGVRLGVYKGSVITRSTFNLGLNYGDMNKCSTLYGSSFGVDLSGCSQFRVEENSFNGGTGGINHDFTGIGLFSCPSPHDEIYKNNFSNLKRGNYADGNNRISEDDTTGVKYICNNNLLNKYDFYVNKGTSMIGSSLGTMIIAGGSQKYIAAGNILTDPLFNGLEYQFYFGNTSNEDLHYYQWVSDPSQILSLNKIYGRIYIHNADLANSCESRLISNNSINNGNASITDIIVLSKDVKDSYELEYQNVQSNQSIVLNLLHSLTDGGSTEETVTNIEMSNSTQTMELRDELLDKSPYLSQEALMTAADKTEVLPEDILFEILAANPDELRRKELIEYLRNKPEPLPEYMISILEQLASGVTSKTALLNDIARYSTTKAVIVKNMLISAIHDTTTNFSELRIWLERRGDLAAKEMIVSSYLEEGNLPQALSTLNSIPSELNLSGTSLEDYNDYKDLLLLKLSLDSASLTFKDIDTSSIIWLEKMAAKDFGQSKFRARAILEQFFEYHFFDCLVDPGTISPKSTPVRESYLRSNGLMLELSPNPASNYTLVKYDLNGAKKALLSVYDMRGMKVFETEILSDRLSYTIDTRQLVKGSYVVRLSANGMERSVKLLVN